VRLYCLGADEATPNLIVVETFGGELCDLAFAVTSRLFLSGRSTTCECERGVTTT
jgi:hypothetical protein